MIITWLINIKNIFFHTVPFYLASLEDCRYCHPAVHYQFLSIFRSTKYVCISFASSRGSCVFHGKRRSGAKLPSSLPTPQNAPVHSHLTDYMSVWIGTLQPTPGTGTGIQLDPCQVQFSYWIGIIWWHNSSKYGAMKYSSFKKQWAATKSHRKTLKMLMWLNVI